MAASNTPNAIAALPTVAALSPLPGAICRTTANASAHTPTSNAPKMKSRASGASEDQPWTPSNPEPMVSTAESINSNSASKNPSEGNGVTGRRSRKSRDLMRSTGGGTANSLWASRTASVSARQLLHLSRWWATGPGIAELGWATSQQIASSQFIDCSFPHHYTVAGKQELAQSVIRAVCLLFHGTSRGGGGLSDFFDAQSIDFEHRKNLPLTLWKVCEHFGKDKTLVWRFVVAQWVLRQHVDTNLAGVAPPLAVAVDAHTVCNRIYPGQER